jgi:hypothetical protein
MLTRRYRGLIAGITGAAALALAASACSSNTTSAAANSGGADSSLTAVQQAAVSAAEAAYQQYIKPQPAPPIPALPSAPPSGKTFTFLGCPIPVCALVSDGAVAGAKKVGWKVTTLQSDNTPQGFATLMQQVAQNPPDALAYIPIVPNSAIAPELTTLKKAGTKIVDVSPIGDKPSADGPVQATDVTEVDTGMSGQLMGDAVVADAKGPASTVFVWDPSFAVDWSPVKNGYTSAVTAAGGTVNVLQVSNANIGKTIPSQIVSYVQAHPSTRYVALAVGDYAAGLAPALSAAGLTGKVKIISRAANATNLADIKDGTEWASIGEENSAAGYRAVDQLIRLMMGIPLGNLADPAGWHQIYIQGNVTQTTSAPEPPGYPAVYAKAWRVG